MDGLDFKRNSQGHRIARLHYTADPEKNPATPAGQKWFEDTSNKYLGGVSSLQWRQEYEIDFAAGSGELVFPSFLQDKGHYVVDPFELDESYVLFGCMDWGTRAGNYTALHVGAVAPGGRKFIVWEHRLERQPPLIVAQAWHSCPFYDRLQVIWCDPSMFNETTPTKTGFTSVSEMMANDEVCGDFTVDKLAPAHQRSDETAINMYRNMWIKNPPELQIFRTCPGYIGELCNLKHPERREIVNETEKIVDKDNHSWDAVKYFLLSHPYWTLQTKRPAFGTVGYLNEITEMAEQAAKSKGTTTQQEFNDLWGTVL